MIVTLTYNNRKEADLCRRQLSEKFNVSRIYGKYSFDVSGDAYYRHGTRRSARIHRAEWRQRGADVSPIRKIVAGWYFEVSIHVTEEEQLELLDTFIRRLSLIQQDVTETINPLYSILIAAVKLALEGVRKL